MQKSIRHDLSIRIGLVILCISVVIGIIYYLFSVHYHTKEFNNSIEQQTKYISDTFTLQLWLFDLNAIRELCTLLAESPEISGLRLLDHEKQVIFEQGPSGQERTTHVHKELRYTGKKLVGYVDIYYSNIFWERERNNILLIGFFLVSGTIVGSFLFINILLKRYLSRPLKKLEKDMLLLAQGDFQQSDLVNQKREIQNIIDAFNNLTLCLKQRDQEISQKTNALKKNISEREHTEKLLRESHEQWERTFNAMSDIVTIQSKDMVILQANRATFNFLKRKKEEVLGKHCYELFCERDTPCPECPQGTTVEQLKTSINTVSCQKYNKIFLVTFSPIFNENGQLEYLVHTAKDITRQKELEDELLQAHKMEAIGTLAGGIAHDFNNILTAVLGYAEIAKHEIPSHCNDALNDIVQVINAGNRARELVKQILTFSRKSQQQHIPLEPHLIVKEVLKLMRASLPTTIEIQEEIDPRCGTIVANPTQLHQILVNLCTNSLHAMENEKGTLSIKLKRRHLHVDDLKGIANAFAGEFVELSIRDTGCGMSESILERIFEPYFTTKEVGKGTGMGLAVVHGIIQDCNGFITVESEVGKGSTFHMYFPTEVKQELTREEKIDHLPRGNERILVVDDEPALANMQKASLETLGYSVTTMTSSKEALALFKANPDAFDLLITDQTMPGMTGAELASEILEKNPEFPVLLCTGYSSVISENKAKEIGIKAFEMKPVDRKDLARTVRRLLDGQLE